MAISQRLFYLTKEVIVVVQFLTCVQFFVTSGTVAHQGPCPPLSGSFLKFMSTESGMLSKHLILCCPLLLLPSVFPSIRVFSSELALHIRWLKYRNLSFSISLINEYSGLISFRIYWLDLSAVQGILTSLLQHHNLKPSVLWHLVFFMVQLSHLYVNTGKNLALTIWTLVAKGEINAFFSSCS